LGMIYEPRGKAREYSPLALNIFSGCDHGCGYCYAPSCTYKSREKFRRPRLRESILPRVEKEAKRYAGCECLLCFTCDPYQHLEQETGVTREVITLLLNNGVGVNILTKGGRRSTRDFDILALAAKQWMARYGATLTFIRTEDSAYYEPGAAPPAERIESLREAKALGIPTWVSFEPVIDPDLTLELIRLTHPFVDAYKLGKWNYSKEARKIDWVDFGTRAIALLESLGKEYYIKKDLRKVLEGAGVIRHGRC